MKYLSLYTGLALSIVSNTLAADKKEVIYEIADEISKTQPKLSSNAKVFLAKRLGYKPYTLGNDREIRSLIHFDKVYKLEAKTIAKVLFIRKGQIVAFYYEVIVPQGGNIDSSDYDVTMNTLFSNNYTIYKEKSALSIFKRMPKTEILTYLMIDENLQKEAEKEFKKPLLEKLKL